MGFNSGFKGLRQLNIGVLFFFTLYVHFVMEVVMNRA